MSFTDQALACHSLTSPDPVFQSVMSVSSSSSSTSSQHSGLNSRTSSVDLVPFHQSLEGVMTWLLQAEEVLGEQGAIGQDVHTVKEQFHQHEVSRWPEGWALALFYSACLCSYV